MERRDFLKTALAASTASLWAAPRIAAAPQPTSAAETAATALYETLTAQQKKDICFPWDHQDPKRGLLRTYVAASWQVTDHPIRSDYYSRRQQVLIHDIWKALLNPDWHARFLKQLQDDNDGTPWGTRQSIALFGTPGGGKDKKFEFVITGRHLTLRADGNTEPHVAFGGPIFYGHAAGGSTEKPGHPHNVFWPQAQAANLVYQMMDDKQRGQALVEKCPVESAIAFQKDKDKLHGIPVADLGDDQKAELQRVLKVLLEPFRKEDQDEALACVKKRNGLDACRLAFYKEGDLGDDGEWDHWRLEGPAFVWHYRGTPHVHVWVNVADDPKVATNVGG